MMSQDGMGKSEDRNIFVNVSSFHSRCLHVYPCCDCPVTGRRFCFTVTSLTSSWPREGQPWKSCIVLPSTGWRNTPLAWLIWYVMVKVLEINHRLQIFECRFRSCHFKEMHFIQTTRQIFKACWSKCLASNKEKTHKQHVKISVMC